MGKILKVWLAILVIGAIFTACTPKENFDLKFEGIVEQIERNTASNYAIFNKTDFMKASFIGRAELADGLHSIIRVNLKKPFKLTGKNSTVVSNDTQAEFLFYGSRQAIWASWQDIVDIKEGDHVKLEIAVAKKNFIRYVLLKAELVKRPAVVKAVLIKFFKDEKYKSRILNRLDYLRECSNQWSFAFQDKKSINQLEVKPILSDRVSYDERKRVIFLEIEIPASLTDFFPETNFTEINEACLWSNEWHSDGGRSGAGLPIDGLRYLKK